MVACPPDVSERGWGADTVAAVVDAAADVASGSGTGAATVALAVDCPADAKDPRYPWNSARVVVACPPDVANGKGCFAETVALAVDCPADVREPRSVGASTVSDADDCPAELRVPGSAIGTEDRDCGGRGRLSADPSRQGAGCGMRRYLRAGQRVVCRRRPHRGYRPGRTHSARTPRRLASALPGLSSVLTHVRVLVDDLRPVDIHVMRLPDSAAPDDVMPRPSMVVCAGIRHCLGRVHVEPPYPFVSDPEVVLAAYRSGVMRPDVV